MNPRNIILLLLTAILISFCEKKEEPVEPPVADFTVSPENGKTTTIFSFSTTGSTNPGIDKPDLFFRWDYDGDGIWDTHFSKSPAYQHRYYAPGVFEAKLEVSNAAGLRDTISKVIDVQRGNSAPFPSLVVDPPLGHIRTEFTFDASGTYDDEDSVQTLKFRWDWQGDGRYDTDFSSEPFGEHMYSEPGFYRPTVQVADPWGMTAKTNLALDVTIINVLLVVDFTWTPEAPTTSDMIRFDASMSYDPDDPGNPLEYRWNLNDDDSFDTEWSDNPVLEHMFKTEGENTIRLQIRDQYGLTKSAVKTIDVLHSNQPPVANFEIGSVYGNLTTEFFFDAESVSDDEDFFNILEVRWDFESDGIYDTDYSMTKTAKHFYGVAGDFEVTLEVRDSGGLTGTTTKTIHISSGTNPTDLVIDNDNGAMYRTVRIGSQWWTAENLDTGSGKECYRNSSSNCDIYGALFSWTDAMDNSTSEKARGICPSGWHIPAVEEWEELFDHLGRDNAVADLEPGGSSDFRLLYAGQMSSNGASEYLNAVANFWTSTRQGSDNAWSISMQAGKSQIWNVTLGRTYKISVRCIKN